jgi:hypothetical protein
VEAVKDLLALVGLGVMLFVFVCFWAVHSQRRRLARDAREEQRLVQEARR